MMKIEELSGPEQAPRSGQPARQLVILLHGLGADGNDLFGLVPHFAKGLPDAHFVSLDAPFPCDMAPYGRQWFSLQVREEAAILEGIRHIAPALNHYIDTRCQMLGIDAAQVALAGFSQGTMLALYTALRREKPLAGVLAYSGALVAPALLKEELRSKPEICLIHGEDDGVVPFDAFTEAKTVLERLNIPVHGYSRAGLGHGIDPAGLAIGQTFLQHVFGLEQENRMAK